MARRGTLAVASCLALLIGGSGIVRGSIPVRADGNVRYVVVDLGSLAPGDVNFDQTYGDSINAAGQVAGQVKVNRSGSAVYHAFRYTDGVGMVDLDQQDPDNTFKATDTAYISDNGQVFGTYEVGGPGPRPYVADGTSPPQDLGTIANRNFGAVNGANGAGVAVGWSENAANNVAVAAAWYPGQGVQDLNQDDSAAPRMEFAYGNNNAGQVTGELTNQHAFRYDNGTALDLGLLLGFSSYSVGYAINSHGVVAGVAAASSVTADAFIYDNGFHDLGALTTNNNNFSFTYAFNAAYAINDSGVVVGYSVSGLSASEPFIYDPSRYGNTLKDLNDVIDPAQHWHLYTAQGINNNGQITGYGANPYGKTHAYRLDPISGSQAATTTSATCLPAA